MKFLLILLLAFTAIFASENKFILKHDGLIDQRAQEKINEIGLEAKLKLDVNIYAFIIENNGIDLSLLREDRIKMMREFDRELISSVETKGNYAILVLSVDQQYANILLSDELKDSIDEDDILDGYVIPLLASKDKNSLFAKTSAATLNGFAQIADGIASTRNIELASSIGSGNKTMSTIWKVFMYTIVLFGIIAYAIIILKERKARKSVN